MTHYCRVISKIFIPKFQPTYFARFSWGFSRGKIYITVTEKSSFAAFNHHISIVEDQKELFDKYTKRLQVVREIKEQRSVEFQGMWFPYVGKIPDHRGFCYFPTVSDKILHDSCSISPASHRVFFAPCSRHLVSGVDPGNEVGSRLRERMEGIYLVVFLCDVFTLRYNRR